MALLKLLDGACIVASHLRQGFKLFSNRRIVLSHLCLCRLEPLGSAARLSLIALRSAARLSLIAFIPLVVCCWPAPTYRNVALTSGSMSLGQKNTATAATAARAAITER